MNDQADDDATSNDHQAGTPDPEPVEEERPQPVDEPVEPETLVTPAERDRKATEIVPMVTHEGAALIKATLNPDLTDAELVLFAAVANRVGLDPFARQIYAVKRNDRNAPGGKRMTIQTGIDGFRLIARRTGQYGGRLGPYFCGVDGDWRTQRMPDGTDAPAPWLDTDPPTAALVGVYRKGDDVPTYGVAKWSEYRPPSPLDTMWIKMPTTMLGKCAEAQAIRACFPAETSGLYTDEEMQQADAIEASSSVVVAGGDAYSMTPREVREALVARNMDAAGKVDAMRDRLAAAIAQEKGAGEFAPAAKPEPAAVDGEQGSDVQGEPREVPTENPSSEPPEPVETPTGRQPGDWSDLDLVKRIADQVKAMQLSAVMRELAQRQLPEDGPPDAKRKRLSYALYLEAGGTPAAAPAVPTYSGPQAEQVDPSTLPLDGSRDDDEQTT